jgi:hypothetical protein
MIVAGIDPGLSGTVALLDGTTGEVIDVLDTPTLMLTRGDQPKRELDAHSLAAALGGDQIGRLCRTGRVSNNVAGVPHRAAHEGEARCRGGSSADRDRLYVVAGGIRYCTLPPEAAIKWRSKLKTQYSENIRDLNAIIR